jgi:hypothetical protein
MKKLIASLILMHLTISPLSVHAQEDLDAHQQKGLQDTTNLLKSKSERDAFIRKSKNAKEADDKAGAIAGSSEGKEEIYDMSSQIFEKITQESKGDPAKMQQLLEDAQKNPEAFYNKYFTSEQKARLKKIADKSDSKKAKATPPR